MKRHIQCTYSIHTAVANIDKLKQYFKTISTNYIQSGIVTKPRVPEQTTKEWHKINHVMCKTHPNIYIYSRVSKL